MTTSRKLWLGFGILMALLVLSSAAIIVRLGSIEAFDASKEATFQAVRTVQGLALFLLVAGVFIALATSVVVGRAILTAERSVRESESRRAALIKASLDCIIKIDHEGRIVEFNPAAERTFGYQREDVMGRRMADLIIPPSLRQRHHEGMARYLATGEGPILDKRIEITALRADGTEFPVELSVTRIPVEGPPIFAAALRDITAQKQAEFELRQYAAEMSEADRRKNEFLAMLAHELRNPLAPIRNALHVIRMKQGDGEAVASLTSMMERQVGQMVRLVDDLLDVSRISRGKIELRRERIELGAAVGLAVEAARTPIQGMDHDLSVSLPAHPVCLDADPTRLAQVLGNLLNNACKFTPRGGRISLAVERDGAQAVIRIRDSGIGIGADQLPLIFDMFTQVDSSIERSASGLGIGLTLVKTLVELHGGTVQVHSAGLGQGTEVTVRLPIAAE